MNHNLTNRPTSNFAIRSSSSPETAALLSKLDKKITPYTDNADALEDLAAHARTLEQQRDALREALLALLDSVNIHVGSMGSVPGVAEHWEAAIAILDTTKGAK